VSFGGMVALNYATRYPDHPRALILESTKPAVELSRTYAAFRRFGGDSAAEIARRFFETSSIETLQVFLADCLRLYSVRPLPEMEETMARMIINPYPGLHFYAGESHHYDLRNQLARIACPTLLLSGKYDPVCPIEVQQEMRAAINPALVQFEEFDDASHFLLYEQPDRVLTSIKRFILDVAK
jgi:pimeloyl-ACP methyl ester carboxylesterase